MSINIPIPKQLQPKPLVITVIVHALLLLFFLLWRFAVPSHTYVYTELGTEVNLGTSADGSGDDQPMDIEEPAPEMAIAPAAAAATEAPDEPAEVERSTREDAPPIPEPVRPRPRQRPERPKPEARPTRRPERTARPSVATTSRPQQPRYVYPGSSGRGGNNAQSNAPGTGEGNTTGPGDRGVPGGTPGAKNYTGVPGSGTGGISHSISGRNIVAFPPREAKFREGGRVIIRVTVDREGTIVNKRVVSSTNTELSPIALRKLQQVRFNKSATAPEEQFGNITFEFRSRQ